MTNNIKQFLITALTSFLIVKLTREEKEDYLSFSKNQPSYADVKYDDDIHYLQFYKNGLGLMIRGNPDQTKTVQIANVSTKYSGLIPIVEYYSDIQTAIYYKYDGQTDKIIFSTAVSWPTATVICANDNIITEIDKEDITIL